MIPVPVRSELLAIAEMQGFNYAEAVRVNRQHVLPSYIAEVDDILQRCADLKEWRLMRQVAKHFWQAVKDAKTAMGILY